MEQKPRSHQHVSPDDLSPKNMLWGLVLALLTFLLVVICVTSIGLITKEAGDPPLDDATPSEDPGDLGDAQTPSDDTPGNDPSAPNTGTEGGQDTPSASGDPVTSPAPDTSYLMHIEDGVTEEMPSRAVDAHTGIYSQNAIIVDLSNNTILAGLQADTVIYPASMTKVMTLLVACENLSESDYDAKITMSEQVISEMQREGASGFGFTAGDVATVRDLLYAIALESDGAAAIEIAKYVAGSHAAFVTMMNEKCAEMELMSTKFTNVTGLHDARHYTTCREMASIMAAAMNNEQVAMLLSEDVYVTYVPYRATFYNTYFIDIVTNGPGSFYKLPDGAHVIAAKTGSTPEAGKCLVSCVRSLSGKQYVIVTVGADNTTAYCADLVYIYQNYAD